MIEPQGVDEELEALRQELIICEAELGVWNQRLALAQKKGSVEAGDPRLQNRQPTPKTNSAPQNGTSSPNDEMQQKALQEPTPTPLMSPTNEHAAELVEKQNQERARLLQKLREEKAKAQRREKLIELQRTAEETLKKQRQAREQLEMAKQKEMDKIKQAAMASLKRKPPTSNPTMDRLPTMQRNFKRPRLADDVIPQVALEGRMFELSLCGSLPMESTADLVSHVFRICIRSLLQSNKVVSVDHVNVQFRKYTGKEFSTVAQSMAVNSDLSLFLGTFPPFQACVSNIPPGTPPFDATSWRLFPPHACANADQLLNVLTSVRESLNAALVLLNRLKAKDTHVPLLDVIQAGVFMQAVTSQVQYTSALQACFTERPLYGYELSVVDLYLQSLRRSPDGGIGIGANAKTSIEYSRSFPIDDQSPLLEFRAYRMHPSFGNTKRSLLSSTYANNVDPMKMLCPFELNGVCNDEQCSYQHERDYLMSHHNAYVEFMRSFSGDGGRDIEPMEPLEYENMAVEAVEAFHASGGSPSDLFVAKEKHVSQSSLKTKELMLRKKVQDFVTFMEPLHKGRQSDVTFDLYFLLEEDIPVPVKSPSRLSLVKEKGGPIKAAQVSDDDFLALSPSSDISFPNINSFGRYHTKDSTQEYILELENHVAENPEDAEAWISLALLHLDIELPSFDDVGFLSSNAQVLEIIQSLRPKIHFNLLDAYSVDKTLHILARALEVEANLYNEALWRLYLMFYPSNSRQDMYEEAVRFLPSSTNLWLCLIRVSKFESVAIAAAVHARAIERLVKHAPTGISNSVAIIVIQWCKMYMNAGQVDQARKFLLSILENNDDKPNCLNSFKFDDDDHSTLWLAYLDLAVFQVISVVEGATPYDFLYSITAIRAKVKRRQVDATQFSKVFQGMNASVGSHHLGIGVLLHNQLVVEFCIQIENAQPVLEILTEFPCTPRLRYQIASTLSEMEMNDVARRWIQNMASSELDHESRFYQCLYDVTHVDRIIENFFEQALHDNQWAVARLLQWTESLKANPNIFTGLLLLQCIARIDGLASAISRLDWVLGRPLIWSTLTSSSQQHMWSLRMQWAVQQECDGDKVLHRYFQRVDKMIGVNEVRPAIEWCLQAPSRHFGFQLFSQYVAKLPKNAHASTFAYFTRIFAFHPPFFMAYADCSFSNDRDRFVFKAALRHCLTMYPSHSDLLRAAVDAELQILPLNKPGMLKLKTILKTATIANPIACAPFELAFGLDTAIGKSKHTTAEVEKLMSVCLERGILFEHSPLTTASKTFSRVSSRLLHVPQALFRMPHLQELRLSRNCLLHLPEALFDSLTQLQVLDVSCNSLLQLPDSIIGLKQLRVLNISHNHLKELPLLIGQLHALEDLNMSTNLLTTLPSTFAALKTLRHLDAWGTHLTMELLRRSITWPCSIELENENSAVVTLHDNLGSCTLCHKNAGKTQRFNTAILCPKCILVTILPLL
ncbi:Aste57867_15571 [Aphanomyces stellatus]|uniref:Aste57867_15571 protein n=1 Tax=Aphanomyces stellatus TaxID=120398 RepID=A0A485L6E2_9STRA|nr:hypothetical protein As57867_015515 [Aphanomyces stellatus]VFT92373.1 Aste57867_15571 [Aphanomyces stellatus]